MIRLIFQLLSVVILLVAACTAPRDNPLDSYSQSYIPEEPPARIQDFALAELNNLSCRLTWTAPAGADDYRLYSGLPNWDGADFTGAERYLGELPGVRPVGTLQTVWIDLPPGQTRSWVLYSITSSGLISEGSNRVVIAAPEEDHEAVVEVAAHSIHHARYGGLPYLALEIDAEISDPDGVRRVWVEHDSLEIGSLQPVGRDTTWTGLFTEPELRGLRIGDLIGYPLSMFHLDSAGFVAEAEPFFLIRMIYDVPLLVSPDTSVITDLPLLEWLEFDADFSFSYTVEIMYVPEGASEGNPVYLFENIPEDSITHTVREPLPREPGFMVWTVSVLDLFDNEARSLPATFTIIENEQ